MEGNAMTIDDKFIAAGVPLYMSVIRSLEDCMKKSQVGLMLMDRSVALSCLELAPPVTSLKRQKIVESLVGECAVT